MGRDQQTARGGPIPARRTIGSVAPAGYSSAARARSAPTSSHMTARCTVDRPLCHGPGRRARIRPGRPPCLHGSTVWHRTGRSSTRACTRRPYGWTRQLLAGRRARPPSAWGHRSRPIRPSKSALPSAVATDTISRQPGRTHPPSTDGVFDSPPLHGYHSGPVGTSGGRHGRVSPGVLSFIQYRHIAGAQRP